MLSTCSISQHKPNNIILFHNFTNSNQHIPFHKTSEIKIILLSEFPLLHNPNQHIIPFYIILMHIIPIKHNPIIQIAPIHPNTNAK